MIIYFDLETNGLYDTVSTVHCIGLQINDGDTKVYTSRPIKGSAGTIEEALDLLQKADTIIAHNGISYDIPVLYKLYPTFTYKACIDTFLLSKLCYPNLRVTDALHKTVPPKLTGSHSIAGWGYRLRTLKGTYGKQENAWDILTEEMVEYCRQDVKVMYKLHLKLLQKNVPPKALWLEQEFAKIISRQEKYGWFFDVKKAQKLHVELLTEAERIKTEVFRTFTPLPTWMPMKEVAQYNKDGGVSKVYQTQVNKGAIMDAKRGWGRYESLTFNPSSRDHIARWLQEVYGWKPEEYTEKGSIIINEKVLNKLEFDEGKLLASYFTVAKLVGN